jgi:hypothetical protein
MMFEFLKRQRLLGRLTDAQIDYAVSKNWITAEQGEELKVISLPK